MAGAIKRRNLMRLVLKVATTAIVLVLLGALGWTQAADESLRALYYRWSPARASSHSVAILVSDPVDEQARATRYQLHQIETVLAKLAADRPALMVLVDPQHSLGLTRTQVDTLAQDPRWSEDLVVADSDLAAPPQATGVTRVGRIEKNARNQRANVFEAVAGRIAQNYAKREFLPVNYLRSASALPRFPIQPLMTTQGTANGFEGKIVLIGSTDPTRATQYATPIGKLSALEIQAHAVLGLVDGVVWYPIQWQGALALTCLVALLWGRWLSRQKKPSTLWLTLLLSAVFVTLDWWLFWRGVMLWGSAQTISALWILQLIIVRDALSQITNKVGYLQTKLAELLPVAMAPKKATPQSSDEPFWQDLVDFGRAYIKFDFESMLAELPEREWHIQLRSSTGLSLDSVAEKRRDIRRAPFRSPFLTQKAGWAHNFVDHDVYKKSLVVPMHHNAQLVGYWLLHMRKEQNLDEDFVRICEGLGQQMAAIVAAKRAELQQDPDCEGQRAQAMVNAVARDMNRIEQERQWMRQLIEQDPAPMLMASLWGPIELVNQSMRDNLDRWFPGGVPGQDLRAVIAKLCGGSDKQVQTLMRLAVVDAENVKIPKDPHAHDPVCPKGFQYHLRSIEIGQSSDCASEVPNMSKMRLVLSGQALAAKDQSEEQQPEKQPPEKQPPEPQQLPINQEFSLLLEEVPEHLVEPAHNQRPEIEPLYPPLKPRSGAWSDWSPGHFGSQNTAHKKTG